MNTLTQNLVEFRPIADADKVFLLKLYASTRTAELQNAVMTAEQKSLFITQQFNAQTRGYAQSFIGAVHRIIQLNGQDIGRLIVNRADDHLRIIDLSLLPQYRGKGIASDILKSLLNEAHGGKVPVYLSVMDGNPAKRLYTRLGFKPVSFEGMHIEMKWTPNIFREI